MRYPLFQIIILGVLLASCSATSSLEEGEQLYTGLKPIQYNNYTPSAHFSMTKEEIEAALATAPNGALFGSSYYRTPLPYGLWVWNSCANSDSPILKWVNKSFGKAPILISNVNPQLRSSVAESVLANQGYFNGNVSYDIIPGKATTTKHDSIPKSRTAKIQYHVNFGPQYSLDSITYSNYPDDIYNRIKKNNESLLISGDPFSITKLDGERNRIYNLLRNNGYYYYQKSYTTFLADTLIQPGKVQLKIHCADSLPENALKKWVIGKTTMQIRRTAREALTDTVGIRFLRILYGGKKIPLRPRIILADMKMKPGDIFSQDAYQESVNALSAKGIFSTADITFTPRLNQDGTVIEVPDSVNDINGETRAHAGVLDMNINAVLDKPYDVSFQANVTGKTNKRLGPGIVIGFSKKNAFRRGEILSLQAGANYEFQTGGDMSLGNSYDFTTSMSLQMPRLLFPTLFGSKRRHWYTTPSTAIAISGEIQRRAGFFNRNTLSATFDYTMQPTATSIHQVTPLSVTYGQTTNMSEAYIEKISQSTYSLISSANEMTFKMKYRYIYSSPKEYRNPVYLEVEASEAGNITNLLSMAINKKRWNDKGKTVLNTPFSQFVKVEADFRKTWNLGEKNTLVAHLFGGIMYAYGNNDLAPFSEMFYISGSNDMRGFSMRSIGPGTMHIDDINIGYAEHNGDLKFVANLEYRPNLFGSLYGALFLDVGNVWSMNKARNHAFYDTYGRGLGNVSKFDLGIDAGIGLRYDLDFFVLRVDWGFVIHNPYDTGKRGFFNATTFKKLQCINFGIGYPF
ncbi:MAG: BamA/TamA family outer membrane protein [Prevotella sp.]|nr:BamA/TamA family outer membrane protein [Candidatus Prevotella equi]